MFSCFASVLFCAAAGHRMWALQRLRKLLTTEYGQSININRLLGDSDGEARSMVSQHLNWNIQCLCIIIIGLKKRYVCDSF